MSEVSRPKTTLSIRNALLIFSLAAVAALLIIFVSNQFFAKPSDKSEGAHRQIHPVYAYSIEPVATCCAPDDPDVLKVHDRGFRSYLPPQGFLEGVRHVTLGDSVYFVSFSPTGRYLAIIAGPSTVIIWDINKKREQSRFYYREGSDVKKMLWGNGDRFLTMGHISGPDKVDGGADVWDPKTGQVIGKLHGYPLMSAISPDGSSIVSYTAHSEGHKPIYEWRVYSTSDWTYRTLKHFPEKGNFPSCDRSGLRIYYGVAWTAADKVEIFGLWDIEPANLKVPRCTLDGNTPLLPSFFVKVVDPLDKLPVLVKPLQLLTKDAAGYRDPAQDWGYIHSCGFQHSAGAKAVLFASGITIDDESLTLRRPSTRYNSFAGCEFYTADASGNYIYTIDSVGKGIRLPMSIGQVQSIDSGALVSTFPIGKNDTVLGGIDASPDGKYLAITSYNVVDIYKTN